MYDPIELTKKIENIVTNGNLKKYYRFRPTGFYGGIATADTVGCNLRCKFCWSGNSVWNSKNTGKFYSSKDVADELQIIAQKKGYKQLRISGGEPTIGKEHLINLLKSIDENYLFILETNGILLGFDETYVDELSNFKNLHVRVCLKGLDLQEFSMLTGAVLGFDYQMKALVNLKDKKMNFNIAFVSVKKDKKQFLDKLNEIGLGKILIEDEEITLYPQVKKRLEDEKLLHYFDQSSSEPP
jgi:uncharacterized Fe-S cluster-containing radical SAM superfamily protein